MAKGGKHLAEKQESRLSIALREHIRKSTSVTPQAEIRKVSGDAKPKKKLKLSDINGESIKAWLKNLLDPKRRKEKKEQRKNKRKKLSLSESLVKIAKLLGVLLFCFLMITPLRSCVFSDGDYVSAKQAQQTAIADSGVKSDAVDSIVSDMIKLDGDTCYKIEFTSDVNGYRYLVNAETGEILAQGFFSVEKTDKTDK